MSGWRSPIALVDPRRHVHVIDTNGVRTAQTVPDDVMWGTWGANPARSTAHSWPTWSPDGRKLACFRLSGGPGGTTAALVMDVGGIHTAEVAVLEQRLPIYLYWSPDGAQVAMLAQRGERLVLSVCRPDATDAERLLVEASPLFFTWSDAANLAVYIGGDDGVGGTLALVPADGAPPAHLPGRAVNFCAPVRVGDDVVYVAEVDDRTHLCAASVTGGPLRPLDEVDGLVAVVPAGPGKVLRAVAGGGDQTPYRDLALVDVASGERTPIADHPCLAFLWSPAGDCVVTARVDTDRNTLVWDRVGLDGDITRLTESHASRDLGFYLRFFEQYGQSHPLIDPDGRTLLIAGAPTGAGPRRASRVLAVPLDGGAPEELAEGVFAVFGPPEDPA